MCCEVGVRWLSATQGAVQGQEGAERRDGVSLTCYLQDKRRRDDFASTEVGEVKGGRVTQQAFEVAYKKDSGISMQRCQEREATGGRRVRRGFFEQINMTDQKGKFCFV